MSKYTKREDTLLNALSLKKRLAVREVVDMFRISEVTARRYFSDLETQGKLIRTHGGVAAIPDGRNQYSFVPSGNKNNEEKRRIGMKAAEFVEEGNVIFLDSGTTVLRVALSLKERHMNSTLKELTVVTNSLSNLEVLCSSFRVVCVGGDYREKRRDFAGHLSEETVSGFRFNHCFLGSDGINPTEGFMCSDVDSGRLYAG
ncbi:MAG: DeoR/GlpR family DNA-binding transcription regulator, partial [Candidatus Firestonebacteria bacterium]